MTQASWGSSTVVSPPKENEVGGIIDGEDDTNYDQWNAMTFDEEDESSQAPPPGL